MARIAFCLGLLALVPLSAAADELRPQSTIQSVIVYPQGAAVTRSVPVTLPAGASTLFIEDLPGEVEADSLKVDGTADQAIEIGSVESRLVPAEPDKDAKRKALADEIQALQDRLDGIADKLGALQKRQEFIERLAQTLPAGFGKALGQGAPAVDQWAGASQAIGNDLAAVADAERQLHIEARGVEAEMATRQKALAELPPPRDHIVIRIELAAAAAASGILSVAYRTPSAGWVPSYDALLVTADAGGKPQVTVIRRAEVTQATGEDWNNVAVTLSTARPSGGTAAPVLEPSLIGYATAESKSDADALRSRDEKTGEEAPLAPRSDAPADASGGLAQHQVALVQATPDFGAFRAEYSVPGKVSVASGVGARALRITSEVETAELEVRAVPAVSAAAYLHARFAAQAGAPFLPGKVSLFRDGAFVGTGAIAFTGAGARMDLGFGTDDRVKVTRTALARETGETGILTSRKTDSRSFRITVENHHDQPVSVTVLDRVPYSETEDIVVERLADMTAPTAVDIDDRRGVVAWTYVYKPGESRDIRNGYRVSWPASESVVVAD
jgi:uncharacterized protein (TIGR02231 family)